MIDWFVQNLGSIVALAVVALMVALAIRSIIKDKKAGKSCSCGSSCGTCGLCSKAGGGNDQQSCTKCAAANKKQGD